MIIGIHHIGLVVSYLDAAIRFYEGVAGFTLVSRHVVSVDDPVRSLFNAGSELVEIAMIAGPNGYIQCAKVDLAADRLPGSAYPHQ